MGLIELGFIGALCLANILFTYINISKIAKFCDKGDYERAIIKGEWLLKAWLPNGSSTLNDFLRLNIAVAYFSLEDDEHFLEYLHRLSNKKLLIGKSYWQCIYYFSQRNAEAYNVELNSVFTPLAEKDKSKAATLYSDILQLVSGLINETLPFDIKEMLRNLVKNPRVRKIVEEYGSDA